jgi:hypothetical protein
VSPPPALRDGEVRDAAAVGRHAPREGEAAGRGGNERVGECGRTPHRRQGLLLPRELSCLLDTLTTPNQSEIFLVQCMPGLVIVLVQNLQD